MSELFSQHGANLMSDVDTIEKFVRSKDLVLAGPIVSSRESDVAHFVFVKAVFGRDGGRVPSAHALKRILDDARVLGYNLTFVVVDGDRSDLDSSLKTMLFGKFPDKIRNSFASVVKNVSDVWIEPKQNLTSTDVSEIDSAIKEFFNFMDITTKSVNITQIENIPTSTAILKALRIVAPCNLSELRAELQRRKFTVPNEVWLSHALDKLRKHGSIVRKKTGEYFLSLKGLSALGTQKNRSSADVVRALALAKKGG